jgi:ATP-dependent DNA helicase RecQ
MAIVRINAEPEEPSLAGRLGPQAHIQRTVLIGLEGLVNRRYGEPVYFHPDDFAATLGLDRTALGRAIRHLTAELPIDYVPPFRGNAVRVNDRSRRARDLSIDFSSLDARKRQEYDKLERMIKYAQSNKCRRAYLLGYFGDSEDTPCGHCDNCGPPAERPSGPASPAIDTAAGREIVLKALSGVARTKGKFGKTTVAQMLAGSTSEKMARWGLTSLSTFGILAEFRQPEVVQLLDALTEAGLVEHQDVDRFRPVILLSPEGWSVLKSKELPATPLNLPYDLAVKVRHGGLTRLSPQPQRLAPSQEEESNLDEESDPQGPTASASIADDPLRERLRSLRAEWARELKQPPYCIFSNQTLDELVKERPRTPHALASVKGMGPARLERYGSVLLAEIARSRSPDLNGPEPSPTPIVPQPRPATTTERPPEARSQPTRTSTYVPTEEWTWRLLDRGFDASEAAAIRGFDLAAIVRHAILMARQGRPIPLAAFLTPDRLGHWDTWRREHGEAPPLLEPETPAELWRLYLACRGQAEGPTEP